VASDEWHQWLHSLRRPPPVSRRVAGDARVAVGPKGFGSFAATARLVTHPFLPERRSDASRGPQCPVRSRMGGRVMARRVPLRPRSARASGVKLWASPLDTSAHGRASRKANPRHRAPAPPAPRRVPRATRHSCPRHGAGRRGGPRCRPRPRSAHSQPTVGAVLEVEDDSSPSSSEQTWSRGHDGRRR